ncbi:MAG: hypothetical protein PHQ09_06685 [Actinomycetota bacterium]|nr:hypothetical protein [Actinomycetota bacterium]
MKKHIISSAFGFTAIVTYLFFTLISWFFYPLEFNPFHNWLSDLGHVSWNISGSIYYRLASSITGFLIIFFYFFIVELIKDNRRKIKIYTWMVKIFGMLGGFSFLMSGIFPINDISNHSLWSKLLYILLGTSITFSGIIWIYKKSTHLLAIFSFLAAVINISSGIFNKVFFLEWIVVFFIIVYITIVCIRNLIFLYSKNL